MKAIYLTTEEHQLLLNILHNCLSDLRVEIVCTENWDFKRRLHERKATLMQLLEKLEEEQSLPESI